MMYRLLSLALSFSIVIMLPGCADTDRKADSDDLKPPPQGVQTLRKNPYPRSLDLGDAILTVYEPQLLDHEGYTQVTVWVAAVFAPKPNRGGKRTIGELKVTADLIADFSTRSATLYNRRLDEAYFPELTDTEREKLAQPSQSSRRKYTIAFRG